MLCEHLIFIMHSCLVYNGNIKAILFSIDILENSFDLRWVQASDA